MRMKVGVVLRVGEKKHESEGGEEAGSTVPVRQSGLHF